jgi:hypothetical protein
MIVWDETARPWQLSSGRASVHDLLAPVSVYVRQDCNSIFGRKESRVRTV